MPEYLAPGVFVEEVSFRAKTIEGVSTTTTGFIGPARFGPVHLEPDIVTSLGEYERIYDPYDSGAELRYGGGVTSPNFLWHAVRAFFTEGGKRLYVSRVFQPLEGEYEPVTAADNAPKRSGANYVDGCARVDRKLSGDVWLRARHPGAAGNLRVSVTLKGGPNVLVAATNPLTGAPTSALKLASDYDLVWIRDGSASPSASETGAFYTARWKEDEATWRFEPLAADSPPAALLDVTHLTPDADPEKDSGDAVHVVTATVTLWSRDGSRELGTWSGLPPDPRHRSGAGPDSLFARFASTPSSDSDARLLPLVISPSAHIGGGADVVHALFGGDPSHLLAPNAEERRRRISPADKLARGIAQSFMLDGGNDGARPQARAYEGEADPRRAYALGLKQFEAIEDISIVAAPGATWNYANFIDDANAVTGLLIAHAEFMRYRVAVLDCAEGQSIAGVRAFRARLDSKHAALYYPWVTVQDPITRNEIELPPSGFVAGIWARNDIERGVHKAPANEVVRLALGFETLLNKAQQEVLNPEGVNCFRFFEGRGFRLWGARTISSDPEWKYLNVRRYFAYLERSIDKGTQWAVFEPNGEQLWANVRSTISDFLHNEWHEGRLLGDKPEAAFFVRCDRSTMTQNDLDNGRLICLIGVAPLKPAEFVIFRIGQWTSDRKV